MVFGIHDFSDHSDWLGKEGETDEHRVFTKHIIEGIQSYMTGIKGFSGC